MQNHGKYNISQKKKTILLFKAENDKELQYNYLQNVSINLWLQFFMKFSVVCFLFNIDTQTI